MIRILWILFTAIFVGENFVAVECRGERTPNASAIEVRDFHVGFSGYYKLGYWSPAFVEIAAPEGTVLTLLLTVPDGDGVPTTTRSTHTVPPHAKETETLTTVELLCKVGRPDGVINLEVYQGEKRVAREQYRLEVTDYQPLASATELIVSLGTTANLTAATKQVGQSKGSRRVVAEIENMDRLPTQSLGFDGVNQIFCSSSRPLADKLSHSVPHRTAIENWVRQGGNIVFSVGGTDTRLFSGKNSFENFFPGRFQKNVSVRQLRPLEILSEGSDPLIKEDDRGRNLSFEIPVFQLDHGRLESSIRHAGQSVPLLVRAVLGFGQVTLLAVDLEKPEFNTWNGTRNVIRKILSLDQQHTGTTAVTSGGELAHSGYDDMAGQLRAALDQFGGQGVRFIPFELLFLCGVIYLSVITVGDYFLLRKLRGRMELTWISFPLTIILFSAGIYGVARATKGDRELVNQAEVIDVDLLSGQVRASCWLGLFSPQTKRYDLSATCLEHHDAAPHGNDDGRTQANHPFTDPMLFSWMGLPGSGLGGMESPLVTPVFESGYLYGPELASLDGVPLSIWSTKCFSIRALGTGLQAVESDLTEKGSGDDALVKGAITNRLSHTLRDCVLLHNGWAYTIGTLVPGKPHAIDQNPSVRTIRNHLARLGPLELENETQRFDMQRIFERMLFHQAAGEGNGTALRNDYLNSLDMSYLLEQKSAILIGLADQQAFNIYDGDQLLSDAQSLRAAVYRVVLPIRPFQNPEKNTSAPQRLGPPGNTVSVVIEDPS